ncbi:MAG: hypothetical protein Q8J92_04705 [Parvibaculum sp.]|nr:hypothetical protein [Parvibaculum sp.]
MRDRLQPGEAMKSRILIYGVDHFLGALASRVAVARGVNHIGAGRDIAPVAQHATAMAGPLVAGGPVEPRIFTPGDAHRIAGQLDDVAVLVNAAPLAEADFSSLLIACLATGTHFIDLGADRMTVAALAARDEAAKQAGVMLIAGAGFDFAAVDALAARLAYILPGARAIALAVKRGLLLDAEAHALIAAVRSPGEMLKNGQLVASKAAERGLDVDFDTGPETAWLAPWNGYVAAARHRSAYSTIDCFEALPEALERVLTAGGLKTRLFRRGWGLKRLAKKLGRRRTKLTELQLTRGSAVVWGEARAPDGTVRRARLETPDAHLYSAEAAVVLARRALGGAARAGYQLPSAIGGAALVEEIPGVAWRELADPADNLALEIDHPLAVDARNG